jgi:hypothetical protein
MPEASNLLTCPHCGTEFCDPSRLAGSVVVCAGCGGNFIFPSGFARRSAARRGRPDRSAEFFCMAATVCVWLMYLPLAGVTLWRTWREEEAPRELFVCGLFCVYLPVAVVTTLIGLTALGGDGAARGRIVTCLVLLWLPLFVSIVVRVVSRGVGM